MWVMMGMEIVLLQSVLTLVLIGVGVYLAVRAIKESSRF